MVKFIKKRDGKIDRFDPYRVRNAISKAVRALQLDNDENITETIFQGVMDSVNQNFIGNSYPTITDVESIIIDTSVKKGYLIVAKAYQSYRDKRAEVRRVLSVAGNSGDRSTTDAALLIESDSKEVMGTWDRQRIIKQLQEEADLSVELASEIAKVAENIVVDMYQRGVRKLNTTDIRSLVDLVLRQAGLDSQRRKQALLGIPNTDLEAIIFKRSHENSNIASNNPESVNLEIAERIQKQFALERIFTSDVAEAHLKGAIHLHDLGYPTRVYCSSHSLEYIKKFGLNTVLANLESKSSPPNSAAVLNQHVQTFLASMQAHYAGALGFGFLNILYSPLINRPVEVVKIRVGDQELELEKADFQKLVEQGVLTKFEIISTVKKMRELSEKETDQVAQNLIFAASQNAFSRGGQTLFIDFNVHVGVPHYMKNVPAVGPAGKYMVVMPNQEVILIDNAPRFTNTQDISDPRNGDADSSQLTGNLTGGRIITYGELEPTSQRFAHSLLKVWRKGDKHGRPFHFPKCDLHVDKESFEDPAQKELIDYASQISSENGSVYFMFDRGNGAVLAQCCRLKERITDSSMLKYPEKLRFCGFQNVTINIAQAAYRGKDLQGTFKELDKVMELALKAHKQKQKFMQLLLDTDGSPMRSLGRASDDGSPYIDLKKSTYIVGVIGLNEAVQFLMKKQLHESEEAYRTGLEIIAQMYNKIQEMKTREGLKFTLEETPAESTTRRFAKLDLQIFKESRGIIKGTDENPYYTNSIHFAPDAEISLIDRIVGQSKFHEMIESGAIVHAYIGEKRPDKESIKHVVKQTLDNTRCAQLVFSPTYTECDICGNIMIGDQELCSNANCKNSSEKTIDKHALFAVTRIVGYYSRLSHWNMSQIEIYKARKRTEEFYAGKAGRSIDWIYKPNGINKVTVMQFGKTDCPNCKTLHEETLKKIKDLGINEKVDFKVAYLEKANNKELADAAMFDVPFDVVPTMVVVSKNGYWKRTTEYGGFNQSDGKAECHDGVCSIGPNFNKNKTKLIGIGEVSEEIMKRIPEWDVSVEVKDLPASVAV